MLPLIAALIANTAAIVVLVYAIYFRRHARRDLALAYMVLNIGVMGVTTMLAGAGAGIGLGLGLFGILSIIRLRSTTLSQEEVAYYFAALALGLMNGLHPGGAWLAPVASAVLVGVIFLADSPRFAKDTHNQLITLDRAYPIHADLEAELSRLLDGTILRATVQELDLVRDLTTVDVRFRRRTATSPQRAFGRQAHGERVAADGIAGGWDYPAQSGAESTSLQQAGVR